MVAFQIRLAFLYYEYFIVTEQMIKDEPKEQMQYTVLVEKVMNSYVYWSVSTVK